VHTVVALDDSIEFRLLALAGRAGAAAAPGWLAGFLAPERIPPADYLARLAALAPRWELVLSRDGVASGSAVDVVVVERHGLSGAELDGLPGLRGVVVYGRWLPPADAARYAARGLAVRTVHRATTDSVADHTLALLLTLARHLLDGALLGRENAAGTGAPGGPGGPGAAGAAGVAGVAGVATPGDRSGHAPTVFNWRGVAGIAPLSGRRFGVLGAGEIGREVLRRAHAFGMRVGYADLHPRPELDDGLGAVRLPLPELAAWSDVLSVHLPYAPELRGLVSADVLAALGPDGILLNTSRGALVDSAALVALLHAGRLGGAGLDVFAAEPLPADDPLRSAPRAVLTGHVGAGSRWVVLSDVERTAAAIDAVLSGSTRRAGR
jgi:lactate dehydrogenase-like 2-hydroxyacid dehydrogenase